MPAFIPSGGSPALHQTSFLPNTPRLCTLSPTNHSNTPKNVSARWLMQNSGGNSGMSAYTIEEEVDKALGGGEDDDSNVMTLTREDEEEEDEDLGEIAVLEPPRSYQRKQHRIEQREKFRRGENDVGSPEFQIASLTSRIMFLTEHLKENPKDYSSTRGIIRMVNRRRKLLEYLKRQKDGRFDAIIEGLGIRINRQLRGLQ